MFNRFRSGSSAAASTKSSATPSIDYGPITHEPIFTPPKEYEPILNPPLDDEQKQKVKDLIEWMDTIILSKEDPYYLHERGFLSEATANRYMRARKWDFQVIYCQLSNFFLCKLIFALFRQLETCWKIQLNGEEILNQIN